MGTIRQVQGLRIGDDVYCDKYDKTRDIRFKVISFPSRKMVTFKIDEKGAPGYPNLTVTTLIKEIESEFLKV